MDKNAYTAPESEVEILDENESPLASRWSRLGAAIVDGLSILPLTIPLMYFTGGFDGIAEGIEPPFHYTLAMSIASIIIFMMIHGHFLVKSGQTLGKKALGIKIVTMDNKLPPIGHLAKRYGFYWLLPIIPIAGQLINLVNILFIFSKSKRCLHDHIGNTKVVIAT